MEPMTVTLMRHYRVNIRWESRYTAQSYREAMRSYDNADVLDQRLEPDGEYQHVITSALKRSRQTQAFLCGRRPSLQTELLNEVPLEPFTRDRRERSLQLWNTMARLQWLVNDPKQPETRRGTRARAREFVDAFLRDEGSYLVISHGFFLRILSRELRKRGFRGRAIQFMRNGERRTYLRTG